MQMRYVNKELNTYSCYKPAINHLLIFWFMHCVNRYVNKELNTYSSSDFLVYALRQSLYNVMRVQYSSVNVIFTLTKFSTW